MTLLNNIMRHLKAGVKYPTLPMQSLAAVVLVGLELRFMASSLRDPKFFDRHYVNLVRLAPGLPHAST